MSRILTIMIVVVICSTSVFAEVHGEISITAQEQYLGLRVSRVLYDQSMLWSNLHAEWDNGFFANAWWSTDLQDNEMSSSWGDEIDPTIGYRWQMFGLDASASVSMFNILPLNKWWSGNILVQDFTLSKSFTSGDHTIRPELLIGWISQTDDFSDGSLFVLPNMKHTWEEPFRAEHLTFSQGITMAWDDGFNPAGNNSDGLFLRWDPALSIGLNEKTSLSLGITFLEPLIDPKDGRGDETSLNLTLATRF